MHDIVGFGGGGKGGGGGGGAHEASDSLHSIAYAKVLDLISEGEIKGPANGLQSVFLNETPLQNPDGTFNFKNVTVDFRTGTQTQDVIAGFPSVENELGIGVELKSTAPWVHAVNNLQLSAVRIRLAVSALSKANTSNGDINGYHIDYVIEVSTDTGAYKPVVTSAFDGKTTSKYERTERINLPKAVQGWTVRVRRLTPNANSSSVADVTTVTSITEVIDAKLRYPMSALVGIQVDASQFQNVPTRSYDMYGRIIKVPSNYDPVSRIYSGVWDGTFKPAWTDNPAWIFYDIALNDRYGLGHLVSAAQISKWSLYQIAQYCDVLVPDGKGKMEPRFTCNLYLQTRAAAYKVLQDLASIFRGIAYWSSSSIVASADIPSDPVYIYTDANVIDGKFNRPGSSRKTRYSVALVSWNDPADFYRAKVEYVSDDDGIRRYGVQQVELTAFGCTSQAQAQRAGNWALLTSRLETGTITFSVGLDGVVAAPGQIVRVADPKRMGRRNAGRIRSAAGRDVVVDKVQVINVGDQLTVMLPTAVSETRVVQAVAGNTVTVSQDWSQLPMAQAVWSVDSIDLVAPMFRIMSVTEKEQLTYEITATQHEPGKYDYIDHGTRIEPRPETGIGTRPAAPTNLTFSTFPYWVDDSVAGMNATLSWTGAGVNYLVSWRKAFGAWTNVYTRETSFDISNAVIGGYEFAVIAISSTGLDSPAATLSATVTAELPPLDDVTGLAPEGAFTTDTAKIKWDAVKGATSYSVQVLAGNPTFIARQVNVGNALRFDYSAADMRTDGGPWRTVVFKVKALGKFGTASKNWAQIIVSNPQIGPLQGIQIDAGIRTGYFQCAAPVDGDFSGIMVWLGTAADFVAGDESLVYDGPDCFVTINALTGGGPLIGGTTYYVRAAGYDTFGRDNLSISPSIAFQPLANAPDANTISAGMIKDGALEIAKFAQGIEPVGIVANLNITLYSGTKTVLNQADGKLYRWNGTAYTKAVTAGDLAADSVTAGTVSAGAINTRELAAGAVTTAKLTVGDMSNLMENPDFTLGGAGWFNEGEWNFASTGGLNGAGVAVYQSGVMRAIRNNYKVKVTSGDAFYAQCSAFLNSRSELCYVRIVGTSATGAETVLATGNNATSGALVWVKSEVTATVPPNIISVRADIVAQTPSGVAVSCCGLYRMSGVTLIQDGAITTSKVAASSITGDKIVGNTITGDKILANTITGDKIQAGSVSANVLTSGVGSGNLLYNAAFTATYSSNGQTPADGWGWGSYLITDQVDVSVDLAGPTWAPSGSHCLVMRQNGTSAPNGYSEFGSVNMTVTAGIWYEYSVYSGAHRCNLDVYLYWLDGSGAPISNSGFIPATKNNQEASGGNALPGYKRLFQVVQAPAGAVMARMMLRKSGTLTPSDSYAFWCQPYLGTATGPNQSQPSPWSPPGIGTQIHGGAIKTSTITADRLAVTSLSAVSGTIGTLSSAASGARFELNTYGLIVYDANGVDRVRVGYLP